MTMPVTDEAVEKAARTIVDYFSDHHAMPLQRDLGLARRVLEQFAASAPVDAGCCDGCGSTKTIAELKAGGFISCCPERKMLSAKEWRDRALASAPVAPQGEWVMVPREPTEAMLDWIAGTEFRHLSPAKQKGERRAYDKMLAAAPSPPPVDAVMAEREAIGQEIHSRIAGIEASNLPKDAYHQGHVCALESLGRFIRARSEP